MILVDTNVIIDFWNKPNDESAKIFENNEIATCGVIKTELLRGSNSEEQFSQMEEALNDFIYLPFLYATIPLAAVFTPRASNIAFLSLADLYNLLYRLHS